jgi:predicted 3-demethylubiquinone-9 3-methyltransferase (glyoxalase superfamily)
MQKIVTFLMFEKDAEEAVKFYTSVFKFTEGMSLFINCADQDEVDYYWDKLVEGGGQHSQCGWLQDRFGVSWQVIPTRLMEFVNGPDRAQAQRATDAMLKMTKIDIAEIEQAAAGK